MEKIHYDGTPKTPGVEFDGDKGELRLKGRSIPENSIEFYSLLLNGWMNTLTNHKVRQR